MIDTSESRSLIAVAGLTKIYGFRPVLRGIDLEIVRGECVALLGPNGSGKSTLLRLLCGLTKPNSGTIHVGGWQIPREIDAVRAQIGLVSHKALLYDTLTARENLTFFARLYDLPAAEVGDRINSLLRRVGLIKRADDLVRNYSRGMLQRLSIARALLHQPDVLLFDEPYTGLDQDAAASLDALIAETRSDGRTMVMTTHDLPRVIGLATRAVILSRGTIGADLPLNGVDGAALIAEYTRVTGSVPSPDPEAV